MRFIAFGAEYEQMFAGSQRCYDRALESIAGGVTHDSRFFQPFPVAVKQARGSHKWDLDGHRLLDYWMGHGSLLLGHAHPEVVAAVQDQVARGTHYGAAHWLEVEWAELITAMLPAKGDGRLGGVTRRADRQYRLGQDR